MPHVCQRKLNAPVMEVPDRILTYFWTNRWLSIDDCERQVRQRPCSLPHRRRRIGKSLIITACSMHNHDEEMKTQQNLFVHSGKSLTEVTNNRMKLLTDTKHRAASLRHLSFSSCKRSQRDVTERLGKATWSVVCCSMRPINVGAVVVIGFVFLRFLWLIYMTQLSVSIHWSTSPLMFYRVGETGHRLCSLFRTLHNITTETSSFAVGVRPRDALCQSVVSFINVIHRAFYLPPTKEVVHVFARVRLSVCLSSWFGIHGTALKWFRSYLSSRCFRVKCNNDFSSSHTCLCDVPQGSVLLCHVYYPTQHSCFISFFKSPPICRWHTTFPLFTFITFPLQHQSLTKCSTTDHFLDDY